MIYLISRLIAALQFMLYRSKIQRPFTMDYRERGSHARVVYPTKNISSMGTARVKQEEGVDTKIIAED